MKKTLFLSAILATALCSSAFAAVTTWDITEWKDYNADTDSVSVGGSNVIDLTTYNQQWNTNWSYIVSVKGSTLDEALTLIGIKNNAGNIAEGVSMTDGTHIQVATYSGLGPNQDVASNNLTTYDNLTLVFSRNGGNKGNMTLSVYDSASNFSSALVTVTSGNNTTAQTFSSWYVSGITLGGRGSHNLDHVTLAADNEVGSYTVTGAGYVYGNVANKNDLTIYHRAVAGPTKTWNGTADNNAWDTTSTAWAGESTFDSTDNVVFGSDAAKKTVQVNTPVTATNIAVKDDYTFELGTNGKIESQCTVLIDSGKTMTVHGGSIVLTNLAGEGTLNSDTTVQTANGVILQSAQLQAPEVFLTASTAMANGLAARYTGKLTIKNVTLTTTTDKSASTNLGSLSSITLDNGIISSSSSIGTVKSLTVTENGGRINYQDFPDMSNGKFTTTDSYKSIELNGNLTLHTVYKSSATIESLSGTGTLTATSDNRSDGGNNLTINSLENFTGNITLQPGNINNKVALAIVNGTADGTVDTVTMNAGSTLNISGSHTLTAQSITNNGALTNNGIINMASFTEESITRSANGYNQTLRQTTIGGTGTVNGSGTWQLGGTTATLDGHNLTATITDESKYYVDKANATYESLLKEKYVVAESRKLTVTATSNNGKDVKVLENHGTLVINGMSGYFAKAAKVGNVEIVDKEDKTAGLTLTDGYSSTEENDATQFGDLSGTGTIQINQNNSNDRFKVTGDVADTVNFKNNRSSNSTTFVFAQAETIGDVTNTSTGTLNFEAPSLTTKSLTLNGGTIGVYELGTSKVSTNNKYRDYQAGSETSLTTSALTVTANSTLNANLVVSANGTMDFSHTTSESGVLTMGCTVSIGAEGGTVTVVLNADEIAAIQGGQQLVLIDGVDGGSLEEAITIKGSFHFQDAAGNSLDGLGLALQGVEYSTAHGAYAVVVTPEPATATLSLLALAALASRRKRH